MYVNIFFLIIENYLKKYRKNNIKYVFSYCFSFFENVFYIYRQEMGVIFFSLFGKCELRNKRKLYVIFKISL